jgi:hypothetical protein
VLPSVNYRYHTHAMHIMGILALVYSTRSPFGMENQLLCEQKLNFSFTSRRFQQVPKQTIYEHKQATRRKADLIVTELDYTRTSKTHPRGWEKCRIQCGICSILATLQGYTDDWYGVTSLCCSYGWVRELDGVYILTRLVSPDLFQNYWVFQADQSNTMEPFCLVAKLTEPKICS